MKTVSIHDAKTNLSKYIAAAKKGERIYIGGLTKPEVLLVKLPKKDIAASGRRTFTIAKGKVRAKTDAFSEATDSVVTASMLGE